MKKFKIGNKTISNKNKVFFIADIAANHDGSLSRAKKLIRLCAKAGADAAKFQHFKAETIVSNLSFLKIGGLSHQSTWNKSVFEVYKSASINFSWTKALFKECKKNNIQFMTSPYDLSYVDMVNQYVSAYKIGSGDITWTEIIEKISKKKKPVILATGASTIKEVIFAVKKILKYNKKLVLMQCNTNYTNREENFDFINLNVLETYKKQFGNKIIIGLSDHTSGNSTVLGAVALGAKVIEKHFTDDNKRLGPDHKFSMNPKTWKEMVIETRRLERSLGKKIKKIEKNELETVIVQRRSLHANKDLKKNSRIYNKDLIALRPVLKNSFMPYEKKLLIGKKLIRDIKAGECITKNSIKL